MGVSLHRDGLGFWVSLHRDGTGFWVSLRQDAVDPGFHGVPAGPAHPDRDADGAGVS